MFLLPVCQLVVSYQSFLQLIQSFLQEEDHHLVELLLPDSIPEYAHVSPPHPWDCEDVEYGPDAVDPQNFPDYQELCPHCLAYFSLTAPCNCEQWWLWCCLMQYNFADVHSECEWQYVWLTSDKDLWHLFAEIVHPVDGWPSYVLVHIVWIEFWQMWKRSLSCQALEFFHRLSKNTYGWWASCPPEINMCY